MNIYLVKRPDSAWWDEYDSFVVIAATEEDARNTHPCGNDQSKWSVIAGNWVSISAKPYLIVTLLGKASKEHKKEHKIVCASYNAG